MYGHGQPFAPSLLDTNNNSINSIGMQTWPNMPPNMPLHMPLYMPELQIPIPVDPDPNPPTLTLNDETDYVHGMTQVMKDSTRSLGTIPDEEQRSLEDLEAPEDSPENSPVLRDTSSRASNGNGSPNTTSTAPVRAVLINAPDDLNNDNGNDNATQALTSSSYSPDDMDNQSLYQRDELDQDVLRRVLSPLDSGTASISTMSQGLRSAHTGTHRSIIHSANRTIDDVRAERKERLHRQQGQAGHNATMPTFQYAPPLESRERKEDPPSAQLWRSIAMVCTFWMPDMCIRKEGAAAKLAWR
jgi:hypothetical protein